jgi:hypothetical protein
MQNIWFILVKSVLLFLAGLFLIVSLVENSYIVYY